ncbi:TRAFAC clade GTPase domain-containing protein [Anaerospora sp.]|uniref:TRAFAC clade GTPase domain-containing protein n=1 Tax=Anaerospora sp. TaxID=1960278 RepID=UPI002896A6A4|nr:GTPase [Anaerospora sp.]
MNNLKRCYIMGLPNAGKTTYLAAIWYSLNNASIKNKIKLSTMTNAKYLANLSKKWVDVEQLGRTKLGFEKSEISIDIVDENKNIFNLKFPDLSGETFQNQYEKREISAELVEYIKSADGILMFINIGDIKGITFITDVPADLRPLQNRENLLEKSLPVRNPKQDDPIQIQIIELLQFVEVIKDSKRINLGIVLSAWDLTNNFEGKLTPEEYIKKEMNMLWQFLKSNNILNTSFWGVSAQGGKLENRDELLNIDEPMKRIIVEDNNGEVCHDITLPIYKVVGGANAQ